jgi:hypothetical protein
LKGNARGISEEDDEAPCEGDNYGDWEEKILDKVKKIWSAQKDELSVQYNVHAALAW